MNDTSLALAMLKCIHDLGTANKYNLIGKGCRGQLELQLGEEWSLQKKNDAAQIFEELRALSLIQSTMSDLIDPENWVTVTEAGADALRNGVIESPQKMPEGNDGEQKDRLIAAIADKLSLERPVSVIYCDLDNFKTVNDNLGHDAGDRCITEFRRVLDSIVEGRGNAFRPYRAGDEFVVLLPNCTVDEAKGTAERIRHTVEVQNIGDPVLVTTSLGVSGSEFLQDAGALLNRAERLMREAKTKKNTVMSDTGAKDDRWARNKPSDQLDPWIQQSTARWEEVVSQIPAHYPMTYFVHGFWSFAYIIEGNHPKLSVKQLAELLRDLPRQTRCLHPWRFPLPAGREPYRVGDTVECWPVPPNENHSPEYWRVSPELKFFYLRRYEEDDHRATADAPDPGKGTLLHLPIWRVGECVIHSARVAKALSLSSATISFGVRWTRLRNRGLFTDHPSKRLDREYVCRSDSVESTAFAVVNELEKNLPAVVAALMSPFYEAFSFFEPSEGLIRDELAEMVENCT